jgi:hypothetical protein
MREPKFSDAPCFGKEFDSRSKICRVCLANKPCRLKVLKALGVSVDLSSLGPPLQAYRLSGSKGKEGLSYPLANFPR